MKGFAKLIGRLPFAGKIPVRLVLSGLYQSMTPTERLKNYLRFIALVVLLVVAHGVGVKLGIQALGFESPVWVRAVSATYVVISACIVLAQLHLGFRVTHFYLHAPYPRARRGSVRYSSAEIAVMMTVTSIGQFVFVLLYTRYN